MGRLGQNLRASVITGPGMVAEKASCDDPREYAKARPLLPGAETVKHPRRPRQGQRFHAAFRQGRQRYPPPLERLNLWVQKNAAVDVDDALLESLEAAARRSRGHPLGEPSGRQDDSGPA